VLSVGHCVPDHVFKEDLEDIAAFIVDKSTDALDSASASESADGGLGDALDVLAHNTPMTLLRSHFAKSLAAFASADHCIVSLAARGF